MTETYKKIDDKTVKVTETFELPEPRVTEYNKDELQTELDHISDRRDSIQKEFDVVSEREDELERMLGVFK